MDFTWKYGCNAKRKIPVKGAGKQCFTTAELYSVINELCRFFLPLLEFSFQLPMITDVVDRMGRDQIFTLMFNIYNLRCEIVLC